MDDLTGGTHIVVVAVDLDQTGIGTFTVPVEVQASIFLVDPVFRGAALPVSLPSASK